MGTSIALQSCHHGGVETVLLEGEKWQLGQHNDTMTFFFKSRQGDDTCVEEQSLLQSQWQKVNKLVNNRPQYEKNPLPENAEFRDEGARGGFREKLISSLRRGKFSSFSASKDVAMAWMKMGGSSEPMLPPLRNSARYNVLEKAGINDTRTCTGTPHCHSRPLFDNTSSQPLRFSQLFVPSPQKHYSTSPNHSPADLQDIPSPPPLVSQHRRFRTCYGIMSEWQSAVDPKSGRTYYYNVRTRETQWRKPLELASEAERDEMERKERTQREFFSSMEANILKSMAAGKVVENSQKPQNSERKKSNERGKLRRSPPVRTISSMDECLLRDLVKNVPTSDEVYKRVSERFLPMQKILEASSPEQSNFKAPPLQKSKDGFGMSDEDIKAMQDLTDITQEMSTLGSNLDLEYSISSLLEPEEDLRSSLKKPVGDLRSSLKEPAEDLRSSLKQPAEDLRSSLKQPARSINDQHTNSKEGERRNLRDSLERKPVTMKKTKPVTKQKPPLMKRNTCGTIYVRTTMSAPDKHATIKCICGVFRAHIVSSQKEEKERGTIYNSVIDDFRIFNDRDSERKKVVNEEEELELAFEDLHFDAMEKDIPSLDDIANFFRDVFIKAQMESDCIIMSLIYVERLIKITEGKLRPRKSNWRSLLFACLILSSKVWDDLSMWNGDFSQTCPAGVKFSLKRINELELTVLNVLKYVVKVPASEYAKYYFLLRAMLIKSGLGGDELKTMNPLDVEGAKQLEQVSTNYQAAVETKRRVAKENKFRSKSMGDVEKDQMRAAQRGAASLEHMVQM